jgi:hypothetical protein
LVIKSVSGFSPLHKGWGDWVERNSVFLIKAPYSWKPEAFEHLTNSPLIRINEASINLKIPTDPGALSSSKMYSCHLITQEITRTLGSLCQE